MNNETELTPAERAARLAQMVLTELGADAPVYPVGLTELGRQLKAACNEAGVEMLTVMQSVNEQMCRSIVGFESRLRRRAAGG
jgi:hypothetical protein